MTSTAAIIEILMSITCAVISGVILHLFKKTDRENEERIERKTKADIAQRELMLSMAGATEVLLKKLAGEHLNGDIELAREDLQEKKRTVQKITRDEYFHIINKQ